MLIYNPKSRRDEQAGRDGRVQLLSEAGAARRRSSSTRRARSRSNATTLPPAFDMSLGHQLQTGQAVPLASFPAGDYRLEIKVTDKLCRRSR